MTNTIATHCFTQEEIRHFAHSSGDWNPIHIDPVAARRLLAGSTVVHGMASLLWALEAHFFTASEVPAQITVFFQHPLIPEEELQLHRTKEDGATRLSIQHYGEEAISILLRGYANSIDSELPEHIPPRTTPKIHTFAALKNASGILDVSGGSQNIQQCYPHSVTRLGLLPVASIMALSRLVGMQSPGLHSLYTGLDLTLDATQRQAYLQWKVTRHSVPFAPIRMQIKGAGIRANVDAFVRPEPVAQPAISEIARIIAPKQCAEQRAVIIGGSRGLGELIAKITAAGGGEAIITYKSGVEDAQRVVHEITEWGGKAQCLHADSAKTELFVDSLIALAPTHLYYFATPHITAQKNVMIDQNLLQSYTRIYVDDFERLINTIAPRIAYTLHVFYPSTIFIDQQPSHFAEYIQAKLEGEKRSDKLMKKYPNINIIINRLPRMNTDQTASLLPVSVKPALREMQRVVIQMPRSTPTQKNMSHDS